MKQLIFSTLVGIALMAFTGCTKWNETMGGTKCSSSKCDGSKMEKKCASKCGDAKMSKKCASSTKCGS